jgi:hypothetical protein
METPKEYGPSKRHPYGGTRQDTVCQPFTRLELAERVANLTESMTGDQCEIVSRGPMWHLVLRRTPEGKMVRA